MQTNGSDDGTRSVVELTRAECRELLLTQAVGRVAFQGADGPRIVPVNFRVRDGVIEFRTTSYSELATYAPGTPVAFEVDALDPEHRAGWSVVVTGPCERVLEEFGAVLEMPSEPANVTWAEGRRPMLLRLEVETLSGRRVGHGDVGLAEWHHPDAR
ncbi:pyridoxamine 5'-phosphate oxidase family protein [Nocardioides jishulii]|uniref:Pyridoxamine 5'-phosphate oxidase family protein n=1 Tax=Nocardioides jishulii TaxID=2575440 RepID=A0A4U2YL36_9ACTN|nr:pyridoxamine 5'-phosphate oxidase family protein [Nocardioides jishulii]QCX26610.1 pyridoxamine 5'-phosphate oxidase family protein [Nocardioides jishulii]TKI60421.1 pyridoxamine 5'-phosphate oxidase family protein [Nocardioides jishulii]